ncbi:MAG: hypothetical protein KC877_02910 [Candidatus Kaiserbacteria bacterium]|nr:hypothetical protein [Candidatus Kaiserbacteria bacterium]MCB9816888.1 hypothetical protein [Candidatus Nomurabacteria bacterium]
MQTTTNTRVITFIFAALLSALCATTALAAEPYEKEATDRINAVEKQLSEIRSLINQAQEKDIFTSYAEDSLDDAVDLYDDAMKQKLDEDWDDALAFADEAYDILDDAIDDLDQELSAESKEKIILARQWVRLADDILDDTDKDDLDYEDAMLIFIEAERTLEDAEEAFDDQHYDDAEELAEDAADFADDVFNELDLRIEDYLTDDEEEEDSSEDEEDADDDQGCNHCSDDDIDDEKEASNTAYNSTEAALHAQIAQLLQVITLLKQIIALQQSQIDLFR